MTKKSAIVLIVLLIILGCSTRKVSRDKTEIDYSLLDKGTIKLDSGKLKSNYKFDFDFTKGIKLVPLDTSKPMEVNGNKYKNVKIESTEHNKGSVEQKKDSSYVSKSENKNIKGDLAIRNNIKESESQKQGYVFLYIAIASLLVSIIFLFRWKNK